MEDFLNKMAEAMLGRVDGPLHFRMLLQPIVAMILAVRDGRSDAKAGRAPYFWSLFTESEQRRGRLQEGWKSISKVFILAIVLDLVYQFLEMPNIHPLHSVIVAAILAIIPYLVFRGAVTRLMTFFNREP